MYGDRSQVLPVVSNVVIDSVEEYDYDYNDKSYSGYLVNASWEYEEDLGYENQASFVLIDDNNKLKNELRRIKANIEAAEGSASNNNSVSNVDLLRRLSQLEKVVYGKNEE